MMRLHPLVSQFPPPVKAVIKAVRRPLLWLFNPILVGLYRARTGDSAPLPPARLRARIGEVGLGGFVEGGRTAAAELGAAATRAGRGFTECRAILDFGCGCGRVFRPVYEQRVPGQQLVGSDVDEESISWLTASFPDASFVRNGFHPPLPFPAGAFDLVYSVSVLTHLDESGQDAWLEELERVLRPEGVALVTLHGSRAFREFRSGRTATNTRAFCERIARHAPLEEEGFVFEPYDRSRWTNADFDGVEGPYGLAFHSPGYLARRIPAQMQLADWLPVAVNDWQDLAVLRKES